MLRRLLHRVGRRGCSLLFLGLLDLLYAQSLAWQSPEVQATPTYRFMDTVLPLRAWAGVWVTVGLVCLAQAFMRVDRVAFAAATALKFTWGLLYVVGWVFHDVPRGWVGATIWLAFGAWITIISTWPETSDITRRDGDAEEGVVGADAEGRITTWNAAAARMFGWTASEILGQSLTVLIPEEMRERHQAGFERAVRDRRSDVVGRVLRFTAVRRDGTLFPIELTVTVWESPSGAVSFTGLVRPVAAAQPVGGAG
jgi:PAS domain S-box-containing protein